MNKPDYVAIGCRTKRSHKVYATCSFDEDTFADIRAIAMERKVPLSEAIRLLVEWGMEAEALTPQEPK